MASAILNAAHVRDILKYDADSGNFYWLVNRGGSAKVGSLAGSTDSKGYRQIKVDRRLRLAHRLAWLYVHGEFPLGHIDHIDRNPNNNAIANLRVCTHAENHQNTGIRVDNASGVTGVFFDKARAKWLAYVCKDGTLHRVGFFESFADAVAARLAAKAEFHTFHPVQEVRCVAAQQ